MILYYKTLSNKGYIFVTKELNKKMLHLKGLHQKKYNLD
jgi:hypothetical protein